MSELSLSLALSHHAASISEPADAVQAIVRELLAFPGIHAVRIQPKGSLFDLLPGPLVWGDVLAQPAISARAAIQIADRIWGDLHLHFELDSIAADSPVRLAQFAAEQVARVLAAQHLLREREQHVGQIEAFREQLALRKAFQRARGILARQHRLTDLAAGELLRRRATRAGLPLFDIAQAVIDHAEQRRAVPGPARKTA